jgi:hypothetical protein
MENIKQKLIEAFTGTPAQRIHGRGRKPLQINKGDRMLGLKPNRKFLGRNRSGRNKIKSKRRNNFKTYEARKILAQRHGVINALKKEDNKYLLTYGDIARLMRQNNYTYNQSLKRWLTKKEKEDEEDKGKDKKEDPYPNKKKTEPASSHKHSSDEDDSEDEDDAETDQNDPLNKPEPFKYTPPEKKKPEDKDRLKTLQARIVLIANGEPDFGKYEIIPDDIQFTIPDEQVKQRMMDRNLLWLKNKDKWVDYKGKDPNPLEKYKGTLGRAMLVSNGEYSFLDFEDGDLEMVSEKMEDLGYEYIDGDWVDTEEKEPEPISEAAGTSSTPANAGPGANSQGIAPFMARLGSKVSKRKKPERVVI